MTAIEKMEEWIHSCNRETVSLGDILDKCHALVAEEKAQKPTADASLVEALKIMDCVRNHGGPVAYADAEDSVGYYVCCGNGSYKDHSEDCWYRKMCEFLDKPHTPAPSKADELVRRLREWANNPEQPTSKLWGEFDEILRDYEGGK